MGHYAGKSPAEARKVLKERKTRIEEEERERTKKMIAKDKGSRDGKSAEKAKDYDAHSLAQDYHISKAMNAGGGKVQDAHDHAAALHEAAKNAATDQYGLPTKNPERFQRLSAKAREASKKAHAIEKN